MDFIDDMEKGQGPSGSGEGGSVVYDNPAAGLPGAFEMEMVSNEGCNERSMTVTSMMTVRIWNQGAS
jgi:hypothetical protein